MNVLITGANGFVGKNLTQRLYTLRDHRDRTRPTLQIEDECCRKMVDDCLLLSGEHILVEDILY